MKKINLVSYLVLLSLVSIMVNACDPSIQNCPQESNEFDRNDASTWENNIDEITIDDMLSNPSAAMQDGVWDKLKPTDKDQLFQQNFGSFKDKADEYFSSKTGGKTITGLGNTPGVTYSGGVLKVGTATLNPAEFPTGALSAKSTTNGFEFDYGQNNKIYLNDGSINKDNTLPDGTKIGLTGSNQIVTIKGNQITASEDVSITNEDGVIISKGENTQILRNLDGSYDIIGKVDITNFKQGKITVDGTVIYQDLRMFGSNMDIKKNLGELKVKGIEVMGKQYEKMFVFSGEATFKENGDISIQKNTIFTLIDSNGKIKFNPIIKETLLSQNPGGCDNNPQCAWYFDDNLYVKGDGINIFTDENDAINVFYDSKNSNIFDSDAVLNFNNEGEAYLAGSFSDMGPKSYILKISESILSMIIQELGVSDINIGNTNFNYIEKYELTEGVNIGIAVSTESSNKLKLNGVAVNLWGTTEGFCKLIGSKC